MRKALLISTIALFVLTCAFIYANSPKDNNKPEVVMVSDSTQVKPCVQKSDSAACANKEHKCQKAEGCKKAGNSTCCKKN